jgi:hypothetical protein
MKIKKYIKYFVASETAHTRMIWIMFYPIAFILLINWYYVAPLLVNDPLLSNVKLLFLESRRGVINPEGLEVIRFITSVVIPPIILLIYVVFRPALRNIKISKKHHSIIEIAMIFAKLSLICGVISAIWYQNTIVHKYYDYFTISTILIVITVIIPFSAYFKKSTFIQGSLYNYFENSKKYVFLLSAVLLILLVLSPSIFFSDNINLSHGGVKGHLEVTLAEFAAVFNGDTLYGDFFPQYQNVLPYLLLPFFKIFGFSITSFISIMFLLSFTGLVLIYLVFVQFSKSYIISTVIFSLFLSLSSFPVDQWDNGERYYYFNYYANSPFRTFGPWVLFYLSMLYLKKPNLLYVSILNIVAVIFALNNLESGVPIYFAVIVISWIGKEDFPWYPKGSLLYLICTVTLSALFVLTIYYVFISMRSDKIPDLTYMYFYQNLFGRVGFFSIPMPTFGLHWVFYFVAIISLFVGLESLLNPISKKGDHIRVRAGLLIYSFIYLVGCLAYYVGRSHWHTLTAVFPAFCLCVSLLLMNRLTKNKTSNLKLYLTDILFILYISVGVYSLAMLPSPYLQFKRITKTETTFIDDINLAAEFVNIRSKTNEKVGIIFGHSELIANKAKVVNVYPYAHIASLALIEQLNVATSEFNKYHVKKIFGHLSVVNELKKWLSDNGYEREDQVILFDGREFILFKKKEYKNVVVKEL